MDQCFIQRVVEELGVEEDKRQKIKRERVERKAMRDATDPFTASDRRFHQNYRLSKEAVHFLINCLTRQPVKLLTIKPYS